MLSASPAGPMIAPGNTRLTWITTGNPDTCVASNFWSGAKSTTSGSFEVRTNFLTTQVFTLTCTKGGQSVSDTATVLIT